MFPVYHKPLSAFECFKWNEGTGGWEEKPKRHIILCGRVYSQVPTHDYKVCCFYDNQSLPDSDAPPVTMSRLTRQLSVKEGSLSSGDGKGSGDAPAWPTLHFYKSPPL